MILGVALTIAALIALHILDTADGTRHRRFLPSRWWSISGLDALVTRCWCGGISSAPTPPTTATS